MEPAPPAALDLSRKRDLEEADDDDSPEDEESKRQRTAVPTGLVEEYREARKDYFVENADLEMQGAGVGAREEEYVTLFCSRTEDETRAPGGPDSLEEQLIYLAKKQNKAEIRLRHLTPAEEKLFAGRGGSDEKEWDSLLRVKGAVRYLSRQEADRVRKHEAH